ncbi:hypothetical protein J6590_041822 [Homalodisca vitripennis]|nr:hypothetical protein J6590_041822 [Homalodisca vitripennis]
MARNAIIWMLASLGFALLTSVFGQTDNSEHKYMSNYEDIKLIQRPHLKVPNISHATVAALAELTIKSTKSNQFPTVFRAVLINSMTMILNWQWRTHKSPEDVKNTGKSEVWETPPPLHTSRVDPEALPQKIFEIIASELKKTPGKTTSPSVVNIIKSPISQLHQSEVPQSSRPISQQRDRLTPNMSEGVHTLCLTKHVAVNTSEYLDLNFLVGALTDRCIDLEKALVEEKI